MDNNKNTQLFVSLIYTFQMQTFVSLGKLKNPMTEKTEKDLDAAQTTIDMIEMLKEKTKNNLNEQESKYIDQALSELKLNFVAEQTKSEDEKIPPKADKTDEKTDTDKKEEDSPDTKEKNSENKQVEKKESPPKEEKKEDKQN